MKHMLYHTGELKLIILNLAKNIFLLNLAQLPYKGILVLLKILKQYLLYVCTQNLQG